MSDATVTRTVDGEAAPMRRQRGGLTAGAARKYVVELIGTFFLFFTVGTVSLLGAPLAPLAVGATLMVMVYAGGHISGGHYNPAVTLAALVRGRISGGDAISYSVVQLIAAVIAALAVRGVVGAPRGAARTLTGHAVGAGLIVELLFTFALCYVVLNVATSKDHPGNSFYGLGIGFTVAAGAIAVGGISGAAFNPAVALGGATLGLFGWSSIWVYLVAEVAAGIAAGLVFRGLNPDDK